MRTIIRTVAAATALTLGAFAVPNAHAAKLKPWTVTIHPSTTSLTLGHKVWLTGKVGRAAAGKLVVLQEQFAPDKPWKTQRNARVRANGRYTTWDKPTQNHRRLYRVVMPATKRHAKGISESVIVDVYKWTPLTSMRAVNASDLDPVSSVSINAVDFPSSLEAFTFHPGGPATQSIEYNLDHKCTRFRGTFGLSDNSESGSQASVQANADGAPWFNHSYSLGQSDHNVLDFETAPLKVHFETASLVDGLDGLGAVGTPEVYCTQ
jgi:hypothetical protein